MSAAARRRNLELEGIFDWLKRAFRQPAPKEERGLIPLTPTPPPSLPAVPAPEAPAPEKRFWPSLLVPYVPPPPPAPIEPAALPAPLPPEIEMPRAELPAIWETMFGPQEPPPEAPMPVQEVQEEAPPPFFFDVVIGPSGPVGMEEEWTREFPDIVVRTSGRMPLWVAFNLGWRMPNTMKLVQDLQQSLDLPMVFEHVLSSIADPYWQKTLEEVRTAELEIQDFEEDAASIFGIPDAMIEFYGSQPEGHALLVEEVLIPLFDRFEKAMEILKPRGLRGSFEISPSFEGRLWLKYKETV